MKMAGFYSDIVLSNLRFIKNHSVINLLKVVYISLYLNFIGVFLAYSFHTGFKFMTWENASIFLVLLALGCVGYIYIQRIALKVRRKEIFVRKWYGGKSRHIFLLLVTEHLLITFLSIFISIATVDFVVLFAHKIFHVLPLISLYGQNIYYQIGMLTVVVFFITCTAVNLGSMSKRGLSDVLVKIS